MNRAKPRGAVTLVYRGQLEIERSRMEFILSGLSRCFDAVDVVHLAPGVGSDEEHVRTFANSFGHVRHVESVAAGTTRVRSGRRSLRRLLRDDATSIVAVGFSAWPFVAGLHCRAWFLNGVPEERLLTRDSRLDRLFVSASWRGARAVRSDLHVVVSEPMAAMVTSRLSPLRVEVVPNAVDLTTYRPDSSATPTYLTYQGGGSPWQGLARLAEVWSAIHTLDPSLRFRVISRDPRTAVLAGGLPEEVIELVSADGPGAVAHLLEQSRLGFLYRAPGVVNAVSWPMKLGEYLAAGAPVVVSDCGWDLAPLVTEHEAGVVVSWTDPPSVTARSVVDYLHSIEGRRPPGVRAAAESLAADRWHAELQRMLTHAPSEETRG